MLNFSSFMQLVYEHRDKQSYELYYFLADTFENLMGGHPVGNTEERTYLSNLYNGGRELTSEIIDALGHGKKAQTITYEGIRDWLIPEISKSLLSDFKFKLMSLIKADESITPTTKNNFEDSFNKKDFSVFLTKVFLYAIKQTNVIAKASPTKDETEFVVETNRTCGLCGTTIYKNLNKKTLYRFVIAEIYPPNLPDELIDNFNEIKPKPTDAKAKYNKICLCPTCATNYSINPNTTDYQKLVEKKKALLKTSSAKEKIDIVSLDQDIIDVLQKLRNFKETPEIKELRTIPLEIKEKIHDNDILRDHIIDDVNKYYYFIRKTLNQIDGTGTEFKIIANSFQNCYLKLSQEKLEQEEIYYKIIDWMLSKLELSDNFKTACQIIVSFFVQNCEVFDEITE